MTLRELKAGMPLRPSNWMDTFRPVQVETVAYDYAVLRDSRNRPLLVTKIHEPFELSTPEQDD